MIPDEDDYSFDDANDADPYVRELRLEMARLQAQIDQLAAAARDRVDEMAELRVRLTELEVIVNRLRLRYRRNVQVWAWVAMLYGSLIGLAFNYLWR